MMHTARVKNRHKKPICYSRVITQGIIQAQAWKLGVSKHMKNGISQEKPLLCHLKISIL